MKKYQKGSEWRRWDLHIHTPGTKKNDQFEGSTIEEKWKKYNSEIDNYPGEIVAIGITDYLSVDNYFKFKEYVSTGNITKSFELIIPNVELRMVPVTGDNVAINIHCLFNPDFDIKIRDRFLAKLKFNYGTRDFNASRNDLIELGRTYKNDFTLTEESAIKEGVGQYIVSVNDLKEMFSEDQELRNNTLIVVANSSGDGVSGLKDHYELIGGIKYASLDATRQNIYKLSQAIFSGIPKDVEYFSGNGADSIAEVIRKCRSLKPCYHGCDAHANLKIFEPDLKRYCWLKVNPTFNGLRQTIYEPLSRVRIQEEIPEEKRNYLVIDSVKFLYATESKKFSPEPIQLNDKLNTIIGGKSSGKSLLLYYIAKTIDPGQVTTKLEEMDLTTIYNFESDQRFDFEVLWKDGVRNLLSESAINKTRQITYIPQMYINFLAEGRGKDELKKLIQSFLEEKPSFQAFYETAISDKDFVKQNLSNFIIQFFRLRDQQALLVESIKSKGDKVARAKNLKEKQDELASLRLISGFTEEDERTYNLLDLEKKRLSGRLTTLQLLFATYGASYPAELKRLLKTLETSLDNFGLMSKSKFSIHQVAGTGVSNLVAENKNQVVRLFEALISKSIERAEKVQKLFNITNERIDNCNINLKPFLDRIQNRVKLTKIQEEILQEQQTIDQMEEWDREYIRVTEERKSEYAKIKDTYSLLIKVYRTIVNEINANPAYSEISREKGIHLKAYVDFDNLTFRSACTDFINKQSYFSNQFGGYFNSDNHYLFDLDNHASNFDELFNKIQRYQQNNVKFNQGGTLEYVTRALLDDYFSVSFHLSQGGEDILKMSPGKKGLILLFLILHLSNADYPILIDQPEDNLDNRTVYTELKDFIREKKIGRQIIIVTHNANLVVTTDAENVIVANQDGQDQGKENREFHFEYVSGALEDSFRASDVPGILNKMGIKEHVCEILEGGENAFIEREQRYALSEHYN